MRGHGRPREFSKSGVLQVLKIVDVGVSEDLQIRIILWITVKNHASDEEVTGDFLMMLHDQVDNLIRLGV